MKKSGRGSQKIISIISLIGFLLCSLLLLYPLISDRWNKYRDSKIIDAYIDEVNSGDPVFYEKELEKARQYNKKLYSEGRNIVTDAEYDPDGYYDTLLNSTGTGIMCYIEIPKIDVTEPVYHYSNDYSLEHGVGHIHGSSMPIGDINTHAVLSGHRGLPSQKIFSDLDRIKEGDQFYIHVLGHTYAYKVIRTKVVLPNDVSDLMIENGKDLITLVTCEPYGVNTHRLLVTGERVDFDESLVENGLVTTEEHKQIIDPAFMIFIGFLIFIGLFVSVITIRKVIVKKNETGEPVKNISKEMQQSSVYKNTNNNRIVKSRRIRQRVSVFESLKTAVRSVFKPRDSQSVTNRTSFLQLIKNKLNVYSDSRKNSRAKKAVPIFRNDDKFKRRTYNKKPSEVSSGSAQAATLTKLTRAEDDEQPIVVERVYIVDGKPERKHGPFFYIMVGVSIGAAIVGGVILVSKLIKKKNARSNEIDIKKQTKKKKKY